MLLHKLRGSGEGTGGFMPPTPSLFILSHIESLPSLIVVVSGECIQCLFFLITIVMLSRQGVIPYSTYNGKLFSHLFVYIIKSFLHLYMKKIVIYSITNPIDNKVIYIGRSSNFHQRIGSHLSIGHNPALTTIINELKGKNLEPTFTVLENCFSEESLEIEKKWMNHYLNLKEPLLNRRATNPNKGKQAKVIHLLPEIIKLLQQQAIKSGHKNFKRYAEFVLKEQANEDSYKKITLELTNPR